MKVYIPEEAFQALADGTRIRLVRLLAMTTEEICLCEFVDSLMEPESNVSRHLKVLKQAGLVETQKDGRWVYHRLVKESGHLELLFQTIRALPDEQGQYAADLARFRKRMSLREVGRCRVGIQTPGLGSSPPTQSCCSPHNSSQEIR